MWFKLPVEYVNLNLTQKHCTAYGVVGVGVGEGWGELSSAVLWLLAFRWESNPNFLCIALGQGSDLV